MSAGDPKPVIERCRQERPDDPEFMFQCPGCGFGHWFKTTGGAPRWAWNGDFARPTLSSSLLVVAGDLRCHSFIIDGCIQFLPDSTHAARGLTVRLAPDE
jgi:hypothetical protein